MTHADFWQEQVDSVKALSQREKDLRNRFVDEYLLDYNCKAAALRLGYSDSFASEYGQMFIQEPYVQQRIREITMNTEVNADAERDEDRRKIRAGLLREAHYHGPGSSHSARVSALGALAKIADMEADQKVTVKTLGGVMLVPEIADVDKWQDKATQSQGELQKASNL